MNWLLLLSVIFLFLLLVLALLMLLKMMQLFRKAQETQAEVSLAQNQVVSKALALLASADAMTYQSIQAMESQPLSLSEPEEPQDDGTIPTYDDADRLYEKVINGEALNAQEQALFDRAFVSPE